MIPSSGDLPRDQLLWQLLALCKGLRNGIVYGAKIRFPHALVMSMLFRDGPLAGKLRWVLMATKQHAWNLGRFVLIFKLCLFILKWSRPTITHSDKVVESNGVVGDWHPFVAGCIGGYFVFGRNDPINNQIVMYLFSRVVHGLLAVALSKRRTEGAFPVEASLIWGLVMWLFYNHRGSLQSSLQASMQYLYLDSERWSSLKTLLFHNSE